MLLNEYRSSADGLDRPRDGDRSMDRCVGNRGRTQMRMAYIILRFPCLTETFVADEIHALRALGVDVEILSLLAPHPHEVQERSWDLMSHARRAPAALSVRTLAALLQLLSSRPRAAARVFWKLCREPRGRGGWSSWLKRLPIFLKAVYFARELRRRPVDGLHTHFAWLSGAGAWIISELTGIPYSVTVHAYDLFRSNELAPLVCANASCVVAISEHNRQWVERECPGARVTVIHCGVDLSELDRPIESTGGDGGVFRIAAPASLVEKKGHADLIEACARLRDEGRSVHCTIIGSGPLESSLRGLIASRQLEDIVELAGARSHEYVLDNVARSELEVLACVVASDGDRDGIPVALMEAAALGRALVATDVSGISELVRDGINGRIAPPGDPESLARVIGELMDDAGLRRAMGKRGREIVEQEFSLWRNAERLHGLFGELFGTSRQT